MLTYTPRELTAIALGLTAYVPDEPLAVSVDTARAFGMPESALLGVDELHTTASELTALCLLALRAVGEVPPDAGI